MHDTPSGWSVQHRGIRFRRQDGGLKGFNLDMGSDPLDARLGEAVDCPAVTAACLLLHADDFKAVGGFTLGYRYGTEDIDLGLKLLASDRRLISCGRAVLLHDESATQEAEGREFMRLNRLGNRELFLQRWGPQLRREFLLDAFTGRGFWTVPGSPHVGITLTSAAVESGWGDWYTAHELGDALERLGWRVSYLQRKGDGWYAPPADLDATICLMDVFDASRNDVGIVVAWIRNWTERWLTRPWFDHLDVLLPSSRRSAELIEESGRARSAAIMPLATNPGRFHPAANNAVPSDYVFTGNFWGARRDIVDALQVREDETFRVFGKDWGQVPEFAAYWAGMSDYEDLPGVYASAKLVLDDTAGPTLPYGAVNCRVFDALAAGTLVITNCDTGVRELFDDEFPTWRDGQDLRTRIDELLRDESRRRELAARYRLMVLQSHTYGHRAEQIRDVLIEHVEALRFCLKIGAPDRARAERWGDTHFARALAKQLRRRGHSTIIQTLDEWEDPAGMDHDVVVHLKGLSPYRPKPGQFNVLWVISHPELITADECDLYDLVCVASERFASDLARRATAPVVCLQQATDPDIFFPDPVAEHGRELVFVGNSRKVRRQILDDLLPTERELAVFGSDWEGMLDPRHLAGEYVPNDAVRTLYSSAAIVLNDHWRDMREHGFVSNRVFDVLACGGTVLSDDLPELGDLFGDAVVSYRSKEDLNESIDRLLTSRQEREERGRRGRELVLAHHTFSHRADELLELVLATMKKRDYSTRVLAEGSSAARPVASEASA
jgi:spore maturation protein CgeB